MKVKFGYEYFSECAERYWLRSFSAAYCTYKSYNFFSFSSGDK
jgi:hypothetical protein